MKEIAQHIPTIAFVLICVFFVVYIILRKAIYSTSIVRINNRVEIYKRGKLVHWYYVNNSNLILNAENTAI